MLLSHLLQSAQTVLKRHVSNLGIVLLDEGLPSAVLDRNRGTFALSLGSGDVSNFLVLGSFVFRDVLPLGGDELGALLEGGEAGNFGGPHLLLDEDAVGRNLAGGTGTSGVLFGGGEGEASDTEDHFCFCCASRK